MGGGKSGGDSEVKIRYAGYIETKHKDFLNITAEKRALLIDASPLANVEAIPIETIFWGAGFDLAGYTSLYDTWSSRMFDVDPEVLYTTIFVDTTQGGAVGELVAAEAALMDDDINSTVLPRFQTGLRDINSVVSSSFVVGKALIEDARVKALAKFSAELHYRLIPVVAERWTRHLEWEKNVVAAQAELMKTYLATKLNVVQHNQEVAVRHTLWPFTVLEYERAAIGALQGATNQKTKGGGDGGILGMVGQTLGFASLFSMML